MLNSNLQWSIGLVALVTLACLIKESSSLQCYQCNGGFDGDCDDPFVGKDMNKVNCSTLVKPANGSEFTLCRKITQKVYGKVRIYRGCGYVTDARDDKDCVKRSGTHDVFAVYCACTKDLCNAATKSSDKQILFNISALLSVFYVIKHSFNLLS